MASFLSRHSRNEIFPSLNPYLPTWAHLTWSGPQVKFTTPPAYFFSFPPDPQPLVLQPPPRDLTFAHPFTIPFDWYNAVLSPVVPVTVALVYATLITYLNGVNARNNNKPWAISKTRVFTVGVLLHNVLLAVYSAWTCLGMINALRSTYVSVVESETSTLAATVDSLCKMHGPRGFGSAATFASANYQWGLTDTAFHLNPQFLPERTDVGRLWNEGLAFYGWIFYLSKFYEVVDTLIIIAKGKKSSFLQTYHHAGAMLCMWAGIRYMSPPIWMFVTVNSFIHAVMYTFYFFTALRIRVPKPLKQILTTMQITQFVIGASYAFLHFFIAYEIPIKTPYIYHIGEKLVRGASALGADAASEFSSAMAAATAVGGAEQWLKKLAFRAAGREGLAENVVNDRGQTFGLDAKHAVTDFVQREETRYRDELKWVNCLDTSGQAFAIYLNILYLLPLTWLFVQFFVNSYLRRVEVQRRKSLTHRMSIAGQSFEDARKGVGRRLSEAFEDTQGWNGDSNGKEIVVDGNKVREELRRLNEDMKKKAEEAAKAVRKSVTTETTETKSTKSTTGNESNQKSETAETAETTKSTKSTADNESNKKSETAETTGATESSTTTTAPKTTEITKTTETTESTDDTEDPEDPDDVTKYFREMGEEIAGKTTSAVSKATESAQSLSESAKDVVQSYTDYDSSTASSYDVLPGMDIDDVLQKAWASVDTSKGKTQNTSSSSSHFASSSSFSKSEVSSTTVFESSSVSRSAQDSAINESQTIRDKDIDTETGKAKKEGAS